MTELEIIDTAVKIGLGALITGLASFWVAKVNKEKDIYKERLVEEIKFFKEIVSKVEEFHHILMEYVFVFPVKQINISYDKDSIHQRRIEAQSKYLKVNEELISEKRITTQKSVQQLSVAISNLHLLGYKEAVMALIKYKSAAEKFWLETTKNEDGISNEYYLELKDSIRHCHIELYNVLSKYFPLGIMSK